MIYHLHEPNQAAIDRFCSDTSLADKPFWMLNTFRYLPGEASAVAARQYAAGMQGVLGDVGAHVVMSARARTAIGEKDWEAAALVAYPGPAAFLKMITGSKLEAASRYRVTSFADQFLIPVSPRWMPGFDPEKAVRPTSPVQTWSADRVANTPNAFIGEHHTQMSVARAVSLLEDPQFDHAKPVYMLNLLQYAGATGKSRHDAYVAGGGNSFPGGSLGRQFGLRVVYSARQTFASLIGTDDWDSVALVSYPSIHHFLSMGAHPAYIKLHEGRIDGLGKTYIVALQPRLIAQ